VELKRKVRRSDLIAFFEKQERCTVVMEACGAAHHWARILSGLGHTVKLIAPEAVKPFVKKGKKNDAADAAAICEAASRPDVKFVPVKTVAQQGVLALHTARALLVKQQTMLANAIRGLATEFGHVVAKGLQNLEPLVELVNDDEAMPKQARQAIAELHKRFGELAKGIQSCEAEIVKHARSDATARRLATIPGIGPITASLIAATVVDISLFSRRGSLPPGLAWCRGRTRPAARRASAGSPRRATKRSASCWYWGRRRCSGMPKAGTACSVPG